MSFSDGQVVIGARRTSGDLTRFGTCTTTCKVDVEFADVVFGLVLLEKVLLLALVVVSNIDDLTDAFGRKHPFDRFTSDQQTIFAADSSQQDHFATHRRDQFGRGQEQFPTSGSGCIGGHLATLAKLALVSGFTISCGGNSVHALFGLRRSLVRWTLGRIPVVGTVG